MIAFKCDDTPLTVIVKELDNLGVGVGFGSIDIIELSSTTPALSSYPRKRYV